MKKKVKIYSVISSIIFVLTTASVCFAATQIINIYSSDESPNIQSVNPDGFGAVTAVGGICNGSEPTTQLCNVNVYDLTSQTALNSATTLTAGTSLTVGTSATIGTTITTTDGALALVDNIATSTLIANIATLTRTEDSGLVVADGLGASLEFLVEDDSQSATGTAKIIARLDDTASTSLETSWVLQQKVDNEYTYTDAIEVDSLQTFLIGTLTEGGDITASSTVNAAETLLYSDIDTESFFDYTVNLDSTLTLFATSTASAMIPTAGMSRKVIFRNASTTDASALTIAAGAGMDLQFTEATGGDLTINGNDAAILEFIRLTNTDMLVLFHEFTEAD